VFGLPLRDAALLTAIFVFPSGIIRAPGGWLSDRFGARTVMYWVLSICVVTSFLLMFPDVELGFLVPAKYAVAGAGPRLSLRMTPWLFTVIVFVLGIAMGIGKAAVFKHIPHYFPDQVGSVGGIVGVIGGLGGFVMPILFGAMTQATHLPTTTFAFLFALSVTCLVWMQVVVRRMTRDAAPGIAEELDQGAVLAAGRE
jgi:NNP family nitrate/nitrite transporter-like MFS transporter